MSVDSRKKLVWPPKKKDLERLYLVEGLSAMKIANIYGLRYKNPKVAESTVLFHLKRNGIRRRGATDHVKKVTEEMVDEWVTRYQGGESLKVIAAGLVTPVTVWNHLKARGVPLRDKVDAQIRAVTKHQRIPFSGNNLERAYLMGLRYGDLNAVRHGRAVRVRVSTTHPAMAYLFDRLFSPYGHVHKYPREAKLVGHEWTLECDLDQSFEFLLNKATIAEVKAFSELEFVEFLAGVFDAEGSFHLHKKSRWYGPEACISNSDGEFLNALKLRLGGLGFHSSLVWRRQQLDRDGVSGESLMGRIEILRFLEAQRLARLLPIRHPEKIQRRELMLKLEFGSSTEKRVKIAIKWKELSHLIDAQARSYIEAAKKELLSRGETPVYQAGNGERGQK